MSTFEGETARANILNNRRAI